MKMKNLLLFLMIGLLAISFALPAAAVVDRPPYALNPDDVTGWWLYDEGPVGETWEYGDYEVNTWYQVWINNNTPQATAMDAWLNATAAIGLLIIEFPIDLNTGFGGFTIWTGIVLSLAGMGATELTGTGLDGALIWDSGGGLWIAMGYKDKVMIWVIGYGDGSAPANPFGLAVPKAGDDDYASQDDVETLMTAQGSMFPGIPGFTFLPIVFSLMTIVSIIFLFRKNQLTLLKTN